MRKIEYLKTGDNKLYAYFDEKAIVVQYNGRCWMKSKKTVAELEAMVDSFNISSVEAMDITGGKSAENKISELLEKQ